MKKKYEIIEHTADIGIKAYGNDLSDCFAHAAMGMFDLITDKSNINQIGIYEIMLKAKDFEQLLVDFLSELLFLHSSRNLVFCSFDITIEPKKFALFAVVKGEELNPSKHRYGMEIKAITYHMLEIHNIVPYYVKVLFDI